MQSVQGRRSHTTSPRWTLISIEDAVENRERRPGDVIEDPFEANGWGAHGAKRHLRLRAHNSRITGARIARGKGRVRFGGQEGVESSREDGDAAVCRRTGHECLFCIDAPRVGAYPPTGTMTSAGHRRTVACD